MWTYFYFTFFQTNHYCKRERRKNLGRMSIENLTKLSPPSFLLPIYLLPFHSPPISQPASLLTTLHSKSSTTHGHEAASAQFNLFANHENPPGDPKQHPTSTLPISKTLGHSVVNEENQWVKQRNHPGGFSPSRTTTEASQKEGAGSRCRWVWGRGGCGARCPWVRDRGGCGARRRDHLMEEYEACRCREGRPGS